MRLLQPLRLGSLPVGPPVVLPREARRWPRRPVATALPLGDLTARVREAAPEELPALLGQLVEAAATALMRLNGGGCGHQAARVATTPEDVNLSAEEAARRLGVSIDYLYKTKNLPFRRRIGRRVVFSSAGLDRWNRQRQERP
jgi:predicted DNA-binding transcriptional regulator AlpA